MFFYILISLLGLNAAIPRVIGIKAGIKEKNSGKIKAEAFFLLLILLIWAGILLISR